MKPTTVDEYIAQAPEASQAKAKEMRDIIKAAAPTDTVEKISYAVPYYDYHGRLIYFGANKTYISLYIMGASREVYADEIKPYHQSKATLHFPLDKPLPKDLITKLVKIQAEANLKS